MLVPFLADLYETKLRPDRPDTDWEALSEEIAFHSVSSQVYHMLRATGQAASVPPAFLAALKGKAERVMFHNMLVRQETRAVLRALEREGIPAIPLKGALFSERYFGHIGARGTSDVDLLVRPDDFGRAADCVRSLGFRREDAYHSLHYHAEYFKTLPAVGESISVELHHNILRKHTSVVDTQRLWREARALVWEETVYEGCRELSFRHTFYVMCLHSSKHMMLSFKHVLDIAHLIYRQADRIDYGDLFRLAEQDRTTGKVRAALSAVYRLFPWLHALLPFERSAPVPLFGWSVIRDAQQGRKTGRYYAYILAYPLLTLDTWSYRLKHLRYLALPPRDRVERMLGQAGSSSPGLYWRLYKHRLKLWRSHRRALLKKSRI